MRVKSGLARQICVITHANKRTEENLLYFGDEGDCGEVGEQRGEVGECCTGDAEKQKVERDHSK